MLDKLPNPIAALACGLAVTFSQDAVLAQQVLWEFEGIASEDQFGTYLGVVGDVDQDGFDDVIASSRFENATSTSASPYVRVYSGRTGMILHEFAGEPNEEDFGNTATGAGDVDADGHPDILIASPRDSSLSLNPLARVYVYSGATGTLLREWIEPQAAREFGISAVGIGDVNGDGFDDVAISDRCASNCFGQIYVYSGSTGALLWQRLAPVRELLGTRLAAIGDVNGDGISELAASAIIPDLPQTLPGRVRVLSGANGSFLSTLDRPELDGIFGFTLAPLGDISGDGLPDFVAGTLGSLVPGNITIVSAVDGSIVREHDGAQFEQLGQSVGGGRDVDGDGIPDYAAGGRGFAALYSGATGDELYRVSGESGDNFFGVAVALIGDTNGDGFAEFVAGGPRDNAVGLGSGSVYVHTRNAPNGGVLCIGRPNSTGVRGRLAATSPSGFSAAADDLTLTVSDLLPGIFGYFVVSQDFFVIPFAGGGEGNLCIASLRMGRYEFKSEQVDANGMVTFSPSTLAIPIGTSSGATFVPALAGETYNFQFWHRDFAASGGTTFNFTDAVTVTFQ